MTEDRADSEKGNRKSANDLWTDVELRSAVDAYIYSLSLQIAGIKYPIGQMTITLLAGPLSKRNAASIRYRMRNISHVMRERGWPELAAYSPASQVGSGVRARIEKILDERQRAGLLALDSDTESFARTTPEADTIEEIRDLALSKVQDLMEELDRLTVDHARIGHNQPPEPIDDYLLTDIDVREASKNAGDLKLELDVKNPEKDTITRKRNLLLAFGLKLASWIGARATGFSDAILKTLAVGVAAKATGLLPLLYEAIGAVSRFLEKLP